MDQPSLTSCLSILLNRPMIISKFCTLLLFILIVISCHKDEIISDELSFIGKWKLIAQYVSPGGPTEWNTVSDGQEFSLLADGRFQGFSFNELCDFGNYEIRDSDLILQYTCESTRDSFMYHIEVDNSKTIILTPLTVICTEGCMFKYEKVSD